MAALAGGTLVLTQSPVVFTLFGVAIGVVLSVATICDWYARLKYVLSISALRQFVKLVVAFLATATVFLSAVIAKQLTHSITLADPASMPEFVRLVSTFVFPFAFSAVLSVALSVLMISQYLVLLVGMIIAIPTRYSLAIFSPRRGNLNGIGYRILNGRRPLKSRPCWDRIVDGVQHFLRPVGTGAVAALVLLLGNAVINLTGLIPDKYVQTLLVKTEYRNPHLCENVMMSAHIVYLPGGYVSVATRNLDGYKFSVEKCHK